MEKLKQYKYVILIIIIILSFIFYWYEIRPIQIRKSCFQTAIDKSTSIQGDQTDMRYFYWKCLISKGFSS